MTATYPAYSNMFNIYQKFKKPGENLLFGNPERLNWIDGVRFKTYNNPDALEGSDRSFIYF